MIIPSTVKDYLRQNADKKEIYIASANGVQYSQFVRDNPDLFSEIAFLKNAEATKRLMSISQLLGKDVKNFVILMTCQPGELSKDAYSAVQQVLIQDGTIYGLHTEEN